MDNPDKMMEIQGADEHRSKLEPFRDAFKALAAVVSGTFGCHLDSNWAENLADFRSKYMALGIKITLKVESVRVNV